MRELAFLFGDRLEIGETSFASGAVGVEYMFNQDRVLAGEVVFEGIHARPLFAGGGTRASRPEGIGLIDERTEIVSSHGIPARR
jgi:hypothetical protein